MVANAGDDGVEGVGTNDEMVTADNTGDGNGVESPERTEQNTSQDQNGGGDQIGKND